jgi:hypothetical protein
MVGQADVADLALPDQVVVDGEGLLQRGVGVGEVRVVEVEVIGAQPAQALLDLLSRGAGSTSAEPAYRWR